MMRAILDSDGRNSESRAGEDRGSKIKKDFGGVDSV